MGELRGAMTAIITPFSKDGGIDLAAYGPFLDFQRRGGIDGVVACGTNGEATSLSVAERKRVLEAVMENQQGLIVLAGTGASSITDALDLTRHAGNVGADAVLVLPPFFYKNPTPRGIADYFLRILDASTVPVLLYSIPHFSGVPITDEILALLTEHPRLVGIKDSAGKWERTEELITTRRDLKVFPGSDELLARGLSAGAVGCISGTANAFPELVSGVRRAHTEGGNLDAAQAKLDAAKNILLTFPLIAVSKSILARRLADAGAAQMSVRPPLVNLTPEQEQELFRRLEEAELL